MTWPLGGALTTGGTKTWPLGGALTIGGATKTCPRALPTARLLKRPNAIRIISPFFTSEFLQIIFALGLLLVISLGLLLITITINMPGWNYVKESIHQIINFKDLGKTLVLQEFSSTNRNYSWKRIFTKWILWPLL
jgi:hypothetical protein